MKIVILNPAFVRLDLKPGDTITVETLSPELRNLLISTSVGGQKFARLESDEGEVIDDEVATVKADGETATTRRGTRGRSTPVSA